MLSTLLGRLREVATAVIAVGGAAGVVVAAVAVAGPLVTGIAFSAAAAVALTLLAQRAHRIASRLDRVCELAETHLEINGSEGELPESEQGKPLRTLVIRSRMDLMRGRERFAGLDEAVAALHEGITEHEKVAERKWEAHQRTHRALGKGSARGGRGAS